MEQKAQVEFRSGLFFEPRIKRSTTNNNNQTPRKKRKEILNKKMGLETSPQTPFTNKTVSSQRKGLIIK
jgi:hypothetical protein